MPRVKKNTKRAADTNPRVNTKLICELSETKESSERVAALGWFNSQSEEMKLMVMARQGDLILQKRPRGEKVSPEFAYSMLILAAKACRLDEEALSQKKRVKVEEANEISRRRIDGFVREKRKKDAPKAAEIRGRLYSIIYVLKYEKNFSWSDVAAYLQQYHQFDAHRTRIQQVHDAKRKELEASNVETIS